MADKSASGEYSLGDVMPAEPCPACTSGCRICSGTRVTYKFIAERYRWAKKNGIVADDGH